MEGVGLVLGNRARRGSSHCPYTKFVQLLVWDFDGTLGYREGGWSGALLEVLTANSVAAGIGCHQISAHLKSGFPWHVPEETREATKADDWWGSLEPIFSGAFIGVGIERDAALRLATEVRAAYIEPTRFRLYPDTKPALERLSHSSWQHALLTNHVPELDLVLEHLELRDSFTGVFNSAETGVEKPHAQAFRNVLDALGPETAWMIGDNPVADIAGAEAVELPAILVRKQATGARHACTDLHEIVTFLQEASV